MIFFLENIFLKFYIQLNIVVFCVGEKDLHTDIHNF